MLRLPGHTIVVVVFSVTPAYSSIALNGMSLMVTVWFLGFTLALVGGGGDVSVTIDKSAVSLSFSLSLCLALSLPRSLCFSLSQPGSSGAEEITVM